MEKKLWKMQQLRHGLLCFFLFLMIGIYCRPVMANVYRDTLKNGKYTYSVSSTGAGSSYVCQIYRQGGSGGASKKVLVRTKGVINLICVYKDKLYYNVMSEHDMENWELWRLDVKTLKYKKVRGHCKIADYSGKYFICKKYGGSGASDLSPYYLLNVKTNKILMIAKKCIGAYIDKNKIYYAKGLPSEPQGVRICTCSFSGSGRKQISKRFRADWIFEIHPRYAVYSVSGIRYKYTYSTDRHQRMIWNGQKYVVA